MARKDTEAHLADVLATSEAVRHQELRCAVRSARLLPHNSANHAELKIAVSIGAVVGFSHVFLILCLREEEEPRAEAGQRSLCTAHSCSNVSTGENLRRLCCTFLDCKATFSNVLFLIFT